MEMISLTRWFVALVLAMSLVTALGLDFSQYHNYSGDINEINPVSRYSDAVEYNSTSIYCRAGKDTNIPCRVYIRTESEELGRGGLSDISLGEGFFGSTIKALNFLVDLTRNVLNPGKMLYDLFTPNENIFEGDTGLLVDLTRGQTRFRTMTHAFTIFAYLMYALAIVQIVRGMTFQGGV